MKKHNVTVSFKTTNKLGGLLKNKNDNRDKIDKTGVYKLTCNDCECLYIGQTSRSFSTRFKEHLPKPTSTSDHKSAFANHLIDSNHTYTGIKTNLEVMHICHRGTYMNSLEEFCVYTAVKTNPNIVLNEKLTFKRNILYDTALKIEQYSKEREKIDKG